MQYGKTAFTDRRVSGLYGVTERRQIPAKLSLSQTLEGEFFYGNQNNSWLSPTGIFVIPRYAGMGSHVLFSSYAENTCGLMGLLLSSIVKAFWTVCSRQSLWAVQKTPCACTQVWIQAKHPSRWTVGRRKKEGRRLGQQKRY